jgi:hypothetical protein
MSSVPIVLIFVAGLCLVALVAFLAHLAEKRRREQMGAYAATRGWTWTERDDRWCDRFDGAPFGLGHNRQARNVLEGTHDGRGFVAFDYVYYTTEHSTDSQGRSQSREVSHSYSVIGLEVGADVPPLQVTPEGFFSRAVARLLNRDIELESEEFNRAFTVTCPDRKFAYDVLHPRAMEYLLTVRDVAWRTTSGWILTIESGKHEVVDIDRRVAVVDRILDLLPDYLRRQYGIPEHPGAGEQETA